MGIVNTMRATATRGCIAGKCAKCGGEVWESLALLDDAYNVWVGICPHCSAANLLGMTGLRGYSSAGMDLVLPTDEEITANNWPTDWPTQGQKGPATFHGTIAGEILHRLANDAEGK